MSLSNWVTAQVFFQNKKRQNVPGKEFTTRRSVPKNYFVCAGLSVLGKVNCIYGSMRGRCCQTSDKFWPAEESKRFLLISFFVCAYLLLSLHVLTERGAPYLCSVTISSHPDFLKVIKNTVSKEINPLMNVRFFLNQLLFSFVKLTFHHGNKKSSLIWRSWDSVAMNPPQHINRQEVVSAAFFQNQFSLEFSNFDSFSHPVFSKIWLSLTKTVSYQSKIIPILTTMSGKPSSNISPS